MQRRQHHARSRARWEAVLAGIVLAMTSVGISPAEATSDKAVVPAVTRAADTGSAGSTGRPGRVAGTPTVVPRTEVPTWVGGPHTRTVLLPGTSNANVDWQWFKGGWEVKFNWAETRHMSRGFSYCTAVAALLPTGLTQGVAASCGLLWIMADIGVSNGRCVMIFVPLSLINTSAGYWSCPH